MNTIAVRGRVDLALLGGWWLTINGQPVAAPAYEKGRALLAYLAVENRWLSREQLGGLFWPDSFGHRANLRQVLFNLRVVLQDSGAADPCLLVRRGAISISPKAACQLDVSGFQALPPRCDKVGSAQHCAQCLRGMEDAASLYRGEFMAGITLADCPDFEEWLQRKREVLRRHAVVLYGRLAECHEQYGELESALAFARRATELDSWDEAAQRRLMRLLAVSGQQAAALRQYEEMEASLTREVGVQPKEETRAVYQRIRNGDTTVPSADVQNWRRRVLTAAVSPVGGGGAFDTLPTHEVRRVVVLQVEPELHDEAELLEPERHFAPLAAAFDTALSRWHGQRIPTTGLALGGVFGLADDGEQAPRRALRAALDLIASAEFSRTRIGICEGRALVGSQGGQSITGSALPALAQRLALCGEPGEVIAIESLAGELGPRANFEPLGRRRFTGLIGEHMPCRLAPVPNAEIAPYAEIFATPFVGRQDECSRLTEALRMAGKESRAVFVEVIGPAGEGKSRLLAELAQKHRAAGGEFRWVAHRPELRHVSLGALRETLRRRIRAVSNVSQAGVDEALSAWLMRLFPERNETLFAPLRALLALESDGAREISGRSLIGALITLLFSPSSTKKPVLLVLDDLHWADDATQDLIQIATQSPQKAPVLAVLSGRSSVGVEIPQSVAVPRITLQPLALVESVALIAAVDEGGCIPAPRRIQLAKLSGGLPLCAEYIARAARDQPVSDASLFSVLQGILDRLGPEKQVLQAAAVFGASFRGESLGALLPERDPAHALQRAEALAICTPTGNDTYAFRHALLRDCAYESIPPKLRREWHRLAAAWLSRRADVAAADIALHFEAGQAWRDARNFWRKAAEVAYLGEFARDAKEAALRALAAAKLDTEPLSDADKSELYLLAGYATLMAEGYGAKTAQQFFAPTAARAVGELADETLIRALCGMAAARPQGRRETLQIMQTLDRMARIPAHRMMVCYGFGSFQFFRGEFAESLRNLEEAIKVGENLTSRDWLGYSADSPVVACRALKGLNLAFSGAASAAREAVTQAVADARREGRVHGLCFALTMGACVHLVVDCPDEVDRLAGEGLELAVQRNFPLWKAYNTFFGMWVKARQGRLRIGASFRLISMHREFAAASRLSPVAAYWFTGCIFEAMENWFLLDACAQRGLALAENGGDRYCMPDIMRQKALVRHARGDAEGARRWLGQATALAETMGSHGLVPRMVQLRERMALAGQTDQGC